MGGNSRAIDRSTGNVVWIAGREAYADKLDIRELDRSRIRVDVAELLEQLPLGIAKDKLRDETVFSGSSRHLFDPGLSDEQLSLIKPCFGDIDLMIPSESMSVLWDFFARYERQPILHTNFVYAGQNKTQLGKSKQINAVFLHKNSGKFFQLDFESSEYINGEPSEWARFSHSSHINDLRVGFKGVFHKYWLANLFRAHYARPDIVVLTPGSPLFPESTLRIKKTDDLEPRLRAFSVTHGLRVKLTPQFYNQAPVLYQGKQCFKEVPVEKSSCFTSIKDLYIALFEGGATEDRLESFCSFTGLVDLSFYFLPESKLQKAFYFLVRRNLWGKNAQRLSRNDPAYDRAQKEKMVNFLVDEFEKHGTLIDLDDFEDLKNEYYTTYEFRNDFVGED